MSDDHKRLWWEAYCAALAAADGTVAHCAHYAHNAADAAMQEFAAKFGSDAPADAPYEGWAHLEIMGHRSHYGRVREVRWYGAKLVDIQCLDSKGELSDEKHQYGGSAIFCNTPMDEETCKHLARGEHEVGCSHVDETTHERCGVPTWTTEYHGFCPLHHDDAAKHRVQVDDESDIPFDRSREPADPDPPDKEDVADDSDEPI